jgi:hypothetical protein
MSPFCIPALHNPPLPTGQTRRATSLAYEWLSADLYALGWLSHALTFHDLQLPVGPRDVSAGGQPFQVNFGRYQRGSRIVLSILVDFGHSLCLFPP